MGQLDKLQTLKVAEQKRQSNLASKYSFIQESTEQAAKKEAMSKFEGAMGRTFVERTPRAQGEGEASLEGLSLAFRKLSDILRNKEECRELREIAGQQCWVSAAYLNGNVSGKLSCLRSNKTYQFDFKPLSFRKGFLLLAEL